MPAFSLRAATKGDLRATFEIAEDAMRGYVEATWGRWDAEEQEYQHRVNFDPSTYRIILVEADVAGFLAVEVLPDCLWLVKLYLRSRHRGRGIGSQVLQGVIDEAQAQGKPLHVRVLKVHTRAQALYARHGFAITGHGAERLVMSRGT